MDDEKTNTENNRRHLILNVYILNNKVERCLHKPGYGDTCGSYFRGLAYKPPGNFTLTRHVFEQSQEKCSIIYKSNNTATNHQRTFELILVANSLDKMGGFISNMQNRFSSEFPTSRTKNQNPIYQ
jgi:hypothetical protein